MSQRYDDQATLQMNQQSHISKYSIYGNKIWIQEKSDFVEAFIFVDGEIIADILFPSSAQQTQIDELLGQYPLLHNYDNLYVFPGLVDINVSLHIGSDWEEVEQTTELFMKGGVTTIACQPLITNEQYLNDELASIKNKKQRIVHKSSIDYCFLANLYPGNISQLEELYREPGVSGFKIYLTSPFQNGAGWVETKKEMDHIMKKINELRIQLDKEETSPTLQEKAEIKKFQFYPKCLLVTFHSIKSGDKELTITSPLRQRKIEERCDKTTQIKRTQGDSIQGEIHKAQKNLEINYDNDDQFDNLTMGEISECINDNILNLKNDRDTSDEEINQSDYNPENDENNQQNPFKEQGLSPKSNNIEQPHVSSQQNREKFIKMYAKATINSTENLQIKLIARAEMQTYTQSGNPDESDNEKENSISSSMSDDSEDSQDKTKQHKTVEEEQDNQSPVSQNQINNFPDYEVKLDKSTSICSPISSPSSNRFESSSPKSEMCSKDRRKESQESSEEIKFIDQQQVILLPFPTQNQSTYAYEIEGGNNDNNNSKNSGKFIKMHKVQSEDVCNSSQIKDEDKVGSLHKIDENADSAQDSNSDFEEDNSMNYSQIQKQLHKKSYNEPSDRSGSACSHYLINYKTNSLQAYNTKRGSHDIPSVSHSSEGPQMKLIKDMKRGSCDKETPSFLNDTAHHFKKSNFNQKDISKQISSMGDINRKEGQQQQQQPQQQQQQQQPQQTLQIPNTSKMRFSEKRKSMNLVVQVDNTRCNRSESVNPNKDHQYHKIGELDQNPLDSHMALQSTEFIRDEQPSSMKDILGKYHNSQQENGQINEKQSSKQLLSHPPINFHHSHSTYIQTQDREDWQDNQIYNNNNNNNNNNAKEELSTRKQSTDSGSTHSISNHLLNQSSSSIVGGNQNSQTNFNNQMQCCESGNRNCCCQFNKHNSSNKSKFNQDYLTFLAFRPPYWEYFGISLIRDSLEKTSNTNKIKLKVVFANIGNSNSMYRITTLKQDLKKKTSNIHLYSETTGAYLFFSSNKITNGQTIFKCEPPIGARENKEFLINASKLNMVDVVSSYHFPVDERFKCIEEGDFRKAFSGICTAGFTLQATWTALYQSYKNTKHKSLTIKKDEAKEEQQKTQALLKYLVNMLSTKPAKILNISHMKGSIHKGKYADFVVWDPFSSCQKIKIPPSYRFKSVHIFDKRKVYGLVHATFLRGQLVYDNKSINSTIIKGQGKLICKYGVN